MSKLSRTCGWSTSSIRASIASAFWVGPLWVSRARVMPSSAAVSPSRRRWATTVSPLVVVGRLAGAGDADRDAEPAGREPDPALGQLDALRGPDVGPADVAAADLDAVAGEMIDERPGRGVVGLLGDHGRLGDHQAAEVVAAQGQLEVVDARPRGSARRPSRRPTGP